jgi:hypothetical protein
MVRVICIMLVAIPVEVVWVAVGPCFDDPATASTHKPLGVCHLPHPPFLFKVRKRLLEYP